MIFIHALASCARRTSQLYAGWACARAFDLPVRLDNVRVLAEAVAILDGATTTLEPGAPNVLIGPTGAGKTTLLRVAMKLIRPTGGHIRWGERKQAAPTRRAMLRRSVTTNIHCALVATGIPRTERETSEVPSARLLGKALSGDVYRRRADLAEKRSGPSKA